MAKAITTLTLSVTVKIPENMNANDVLNFIRGRLSMDESLSTLSPVDQKRIGEAIANEEASLRLIRKVTEY